MSLDHDEIYAAQLKREEAERNRDPYDQFGGYGRGFDDTLDNKNADTSYDVKSQNFRVSTYGMTA